MSQKLQTRPQTTKEVSCDASTEVKSAQFIKQMIALPISNIVFLRGIFGEQEFSDRYIGDLRIKMLRYKKDKSDENIHLLMEWMRGCFDAIDNKYLKSVTLTIHNTNEPRENPIESYTFSVGYKGDQVGSLSMQRNGKHVSNETFTEKGLKKASVDCLSKLCDDIAVLDLLPDEVVLNMELTYYDEVTPADYEPAGFRAAAPKPKPEAEEVGGIDTKFHSLRMKVFTRQFHDLSRSASLHNHASETSVLSVNSAPSTADASPKLSNSASKRSQQQPSSSKAHRPPKATPSTAAAQPHPTPQPSTVEYPAADPARRRSGNGRASILSFDEALDASNRDFIVEDSMVVDESSVLDGTLGAGDGTNNNINTLNNNSTSSGSRKTRKPGAKSAVDNQRRNGSGDASASMEKAVGGEEEEPMIVEEEEEEEEEEEPMIVEEEEEEEEEEEMMGGRGRGGKGKRSANKKAAKKRGHDASPAPSKASENVRVAKKARK